MRGMTNSSEAPRPRSIRIGHVRLCGVDKVNRPSSVIAQGHAETMFWLARCWAATRTAAIEASGRRKFQETSFRDGRRLNREEATCSLVRLPSYRRCRPRLGGRLSWPRGISRHRQMCCQKMDVGSRLVILAIWVDHHWNVIPDH